MDFGVRSPLALRAFYLYNLSDKHSEDNLDRRQRKTSESTRPVNLKVDSFQGEWVPLGWSKLTHTSQMDLNGP